MVGNAQQTIKDGYEAFGSELGAEKICNDTLSRCCEWFGEGSVIVAGEPIRVFRTDDSSSRITRRMLTQVRKAWDPLLAQRGFPFATRDPRYYAIFLSYLAARRAGPKKRIDFWEDLELTQLVAIELWEQTVALVEETEQRQRELDRLKKSGELLSASSPPVPRRTLMAEVESHSETFPSADDWLDAWAPGDSPQDMLARIWTRQVYPAVRLGTPRVSDGLALAEMYGSLTGAPGPMARAFLALAERFAEAEHTDHVEWMLRTSRDLWSEPSLSAPRALEAVRRSAS